MADVPKNETTTTRKPEMTFPSICYFMLVLLGVDEGGITASACNPT